MHNSKSWKFLFTAGRHVIHTRVRLRTERQIQCDVIIGKNLEGSVHLRKLRWEQIEHVQRDLESQEGQAISYNRIHLPAHNISGGCNCATSTNPGVNQPMRSLYFPWIARGFVQLSKIMLRQWGADMESLNYRGYPILWLSACGTFGCMFHRFPTLCFELEQIWDHIYNIIVY